MTLCFVVRCCVLVCVGMCWCESGVVWLGVLMCVMMLCCAMLCVVVCCCVFHGVVYCCYLRCVVVC